MKTQYIPAELKTRLGNNKTASQYRMTPEAHDYINTNTDTDVVSIPKGLSELDYEAQYTLLEEEGHSVKDNAYMSLLSDYLAEVSWSEVLQEQQRRCMDDTTLLKHTIRELRK